MADDQYPLGSALFFEQNVKRKLFQIAATFPGPIEVMMFRMRVYHFEGAIKFLPESIIQLFGYGQVALPDLSDIFHRQRMNVESHAAHYLPHAARNSSSDRP